MTSPAALIKKLLQPKMLLLGAVLIGVLYIGGFLTLFPGLFTGNDRDMTLPDGKVVKVLDNGLNVIVGANTITATSQAAATQSNIVHVRLVPSLDGTEKVGIRGEAKINGGTNNFPANAALFIIIEDTNGNNAVELLRAGRHDGTKVSSLFGGDVPGGVKDGFTLTDANSQASVGNVEYTIPAAYRTSQYRLIVEMHVAGKFHQAQIIYRFDGVDITKTGGLILAPANAPGAPSLSSLISAIRDWIKRMLDAVPFLSVVGTQSTSLGSTQTYQAALTAPHALDSAFADGTYAVRYCNTALVKTDGTILAETGFETCTDSYAKSFTAKLPSQAGQYAVIAVMAESKGTYSTTTTYGTETSAWAFAPYEVIAKDALDITTKAPIPGAADIPLKPSGNFLTNLLRALFGWLPFFK